LTVTDAEHDEPPALRRDAQENRRRLVGAAIAAVRREGYQVPLATRAADAGVGIGTLYRHFPSREALLDELIYDSYLRVLRNAGDAEANAASGLDAVSRFIDAALRDRHLLVALPLHGGPDVSSDRTRQARRRVGQATARLIARGQQDGTIRTDATARDVVLFAVLLAQSKPPVADWVPASQRLKAVFLRGLQP
jgi:AcrR family transcriptional regulator